jgi:uncharacterized protein YndB with AHSA1/START domain
MSASADPAAKSSAGPEGDLDIVVTRWMDVPRERVWQAFTKPEHLDVWWGPHAYRTETHSLDFAVGGFWRYTMFGNDGSVYPNWIHYTRIEPPSIIAYDHGGEHDAPRHFKAVILLMVEGGGTRITLRLTFPDRAARDATLEFGAVEGGRETLERLEHWSRERISA